MKERFLRRKDIAERLNCGWKKARNILASHGVHPVDFGCGRSGGLRWLESAVDAVLLQMHMEAQPKMRKARLTTVTTGLLALSTSEIFDMVAEPRKLN